MVRPNDEADDGNTDTRSSDKAIAENRFANEGWNDFADYAHGRKNHDVHSRVRVEPEKVLEENRIAAVRRIEKAEVEHALEAGEKQRDGDNGRAENHDQAGGVMRPDEQRQAEPGHAGSAHGMDGDKKIEAGED